MLGRIASGAPAKLLIVRLLVSTRGVGKVFGWWATMSSKIRLGGWILIGGKNVLQCVKKTCALISSTF